MKKLFGLLFGKKKQYSEKDIAIANAIVSHILNADRGSTAAIKKTRT